MNGRGVFHEVLRLVVLGLPRGHGLLVDVLLGQSGALLLGGRGGGGPRRLFSRECGPKCIKHVGLLWGQV